MLWVWPSAGPGDSALDWAVWVADRCTGTAVSWAAADMPAPLPLEMEMPLLKGTSIADAKQERERERERVLEGERSVGRCTSR